MKNLLSLVLLLFCAAPGRAQNTIASFAAGTWKVDDISIDNNNDGTPELQLWKPCRAGSTYTFNADGTGTYYKGPKPCNTGEAAGESFTWSIINLILTITADGKSEVVSVALADAQHAVLWFTNSKARFVLER